MANSARQKFGKVAKKANATCHRESNSTTTFATCMRREMRAGLKKEGFKVGGKGRKGRRRRR
jgi:hypothetical protein